MQAHGYGYKTFDIETDAQGEPIVHRLDGQHPVSHYLDIIYRTVIDEVGAVFDTRQNVYLIVIDSQRGGGIGLKWGKIGGEAWILGHVGFFIAAHELGHAFGLVHDFRDNEYIMSYGWVRRSLSACHAEFLAVHPYFNPDIRVEGDSDGSFSGPIDGKTGGTFELTSPVEYPTGSTTVSIRLNVSDPNGLHQVLLFVRTKQPHPAAGSLEVKACLGLEGETRAAVVFDYDGVLPSDSGTSLSNPVRHEIFVRAVDIEGNVQRGAFFSLIEISPHHIGTLRHTRGVASVVFSPDGTMLATGSNGGTVKLWDVATQTNVGTFGSGRSVAFSPDGNVLASGGTTDGTVGTIKLWDLATRNQIKMLSHGRWVQTIAISRDGTTMASGSWGGLGYDNTIELWSLAEREHIGTLGRHSGWVTSVAFAADSATLASGSLGEGAIKLWDVSTRKHIATLSDAEVRISDISSVAFSPDGSTIASGSGSGYVYDLLNLWDVATRKHVAILANRGGIRTVAFSPDGSVLASGGGDGAIKLWDVATRDAIVSLAGHVRDVQSLAFSPDGDILASGSEDSTLRLWDVSEWTINRPQPRTLQIISGNNQQTSTGSQLPNRLVVEVRDQNSRPLQGVQVTFSVIGGDGRLSQGSTVENVNTDANGRAAVRMTLGANPGTTVVVASVAGLDVVTFSSVATDSVGDPNDNRLRGHRRVVRSVAFSPDGQ